MRCNRLYVCIRYRFRFRKYRAVGDMCSVYIKLGTRSRTTERQIYFLSLIGFVYVYIFSVPTLAAVIASAAVETVLRIPVCGSDIPVKPVKSISNVGLEDISAAPRGEFFSLINIQSGFSFTIVLAPSLISFNRKFSFAVISEFAPYLYPPERNYHQRLLPPDKAV